MPSGKLLASPSIEVEKFASRPDLVEIHARSRASTAKCPTCGMESSRIHSRYVRTLADLPWHGVRVVVRLLVRRLRCDADGCPRRIFAEQTDDLARPYARKTTRLAEVVAMLGFVLGGEPGSRTARRLGMPASPDTILRAVRRAAAEPAPTPRALGVDDWAKRRGHRYGTILVDLERRRPIDLLPDREAATLAAWLEARPGVEVITRDRGGAYAEGARTGAPSAMQVADRWHLLKNLGEMFERVLTRRNAALRDAAAVAAVPEADAWAAGPLRGAGEKAARRERRLTRYEQVRALVSQGVSERAIARRLGMARGTVRSYRAAETFPEIARRAPRPRLIDPYIPYLKQRWTEGCRNSSQLCREIQARGYTGATTKVRSFLQGWKERHEAGASHCALEILPTGRGLQVPSPRRARWILVKEADALRSDELAFRERLLANDTEIAGVVERVTVFTEMVRERQSERLDAWIEEAKASGVSEVRGFAEGLERDRKAVEAALRTQWSNGQVEGHVNRLKLLKRSMYGRANLDLLKARVLYGT